MIKEAFLNRNKFYWVALLVTAILCFGFMLTNFSIGIDDEAFATFFEGHVLLTQGRWGHLVVSQLFNSGEFIPFWRDFLAVILLIVAATFWVRLFEDYFHEKFDEVAAIIFACIFISTPYFANLMMFMPATVELGCLMVVTPLAIHASLKWVIQRQSIWFALFGGILLGFSVSFYENAAVLYVSGSFLCLLAYLLSLEEKRQFPLSRLMIFSLKIGSIAIMGIVFCRVVGLAFMAIYQLEPIGYQGLFIKYDTSSLTAFVHSFVSYLVHFPVNVFREANNLPSKLYLISSVIVLVISVILTIKRKRLSILLAAGFAVLFSYGMYFITGSYAPAVRILTTNGLLVSFSFVLLYLTLKPFRFKQFSIVYIVFFFVVQIVFYQTKHVNQLYYEDYKRYQLDVAQMNSLMHEIDAVNTAKPIRFIGMLQPYQFPYVFDEIVGVSMFNLQRINNETQNARITGFFNMHGYQIEQADISLERISKDVVGMQNWPAPDSIKEMDDYILVKLGPSMFDPTS